MSDAFTDAYRVEQEQKKLSYYFNSVKKYIIDPTVRNFNLAVEAGVCAYSLVYRKKFEKEGFEEQLKRLSSKDKQAWSKFLADAISEYVFKELKVLSPFADKFLILVDYGQGFVHISLPQIENAISEVIKSKDMKTYDCDSYLIALPQIDFKDAEVYWLRCGILGVNSSRKSK